MPLPRVRWPARAQPGWLAPGQWATAAGIRALGEVARHMGDVDLERRLATPVVLRLIFATMARSYDPSAGEGFQGLILFELTRPASGRPASWWLVSVGSDGTAEATPGGTANEADAEIRVRLPVADLLRIAGGLIDPVEPVLAGRARVSGDLQLAVRLGEMLGAPALR